MSCISSHKAVILQSFMEQVCWGTQEHTVFWFSICFWSIGSLSLLLATTCNLCYPKFITIIQSCPDGISIDRWAQAFSITILTWGLQDFLGTNSPSQREAGNLILPVDKRKYMHITNSSLSSGQRNDSLGDSGTNNDTDAAGLPLLLLFLSFLLFYFTVWR